MAKLCWTNVSSVEILSRIIETGPKTEYQTVLSIPDLPWSTLGHVLYTEMSIERWGGASHVLIPLRTTAAEAFCFGSEHTLLTTR